MPRACPSVNWAQSGTDSLNGLLAKPEGSVVPGDDTRVESAEIDFQRPTSSDPSAGYSVPNSLLEA